MPVVEHARAHQEIECSDAVTDQWRISFGASQTASAACLCESGGVYKWVSKEVEQVG